MGGKFKFIYDAFVGEDVPGKEGNFNAALEVATGRYLRTTLSDAPSLVCKPRFSVGQFVFVRRFRQVHTRHLRAHRPGAAIIEVALTLPILVLICLATVDTCKVIYVKQSAKIAAFECARIGIVPGIKREQLERLCNSIMARRNVHGALLTLSVPELSGLAKGDLLTVSVAVPANSNALSSSWFYRGQTFDESVSILVEQ